MKYGLFPVIRSRANPIHLSAREYRAIVRARDGIVSLAGIEETFDLLLQNYLDFEREILDIALKQVVIRDFRYQVMREQTLLVIRRLGNLLSTSKLYVDSTPRELSALFGKKHAVFVSVKKKFSEEYDAALGYRLMETLRNTLQHRGGSAVTVSYSANAEESKGGHRVHHRVLPLLSMAHLKKGDIKASVRKEIGTEPNAELLGHVRQYIDGLAQVHYDFRRRTSRARARWEKTFREAYRRGDAAWPAKEMRASDLAAVDSRGIVRESRHIFLAPLDYLGGLERKNAGPIRLANMYVSNASKGDA